ncbi:MAG: 30S ribosomal protein S21 [Planctomycetota bacterium]
MIKVKLRGGETTDQLLKRFKKACEKEGLVKDMKKHAYYEKPSEINRRKSKMRRPMTQR